MIYALLTFGMIVILIAGMILAARMGPHMEEQEPKSRASRRLAVIRQSSLLR